MPGPRLLVLALAATTLAAAGCASSSNTGSRRPAIKVGYAFGYDAGDVGDRIAFERLRLRSGIDVRIRDLGGVANAVVALVRGDVQLATMPYSTAIRAAEEGAHLRVVLGANMASEFILVGRDEVDSVAELRGRRIAFDAPGLDGETLVREALAEGDVPSSEVKLSALNGSTSRATALASGRVDAAVLEQVDYERLLARGEALTVLARLSDFRPRSTQTVWVVSQKYERTHRALLGRVVDGLLAGYAFVYTPAGRRAWLALARRSVLEDENPALAANVYAFYRRIRFWPLRDEPVTAEQHSRTVRFWIGAHQLEHFVPFARVWDESFWLDAEG